MGDGAIGPVGAIFGFFAFIVIWFVWLGGWLNELGQSIIDANGYTGLEAFFYSNLNLTIMIGMFLGMLGFMYFTRE